MGETIHRGLTIRTRPEVYEPAEDSWLLADALLDLPDLNGERAVDVGTGAGVAALALAARGARVVATDVNPHACRLARRNAAANGLAPRVAVARGDLFGPLCPGARFRVASFNAPYLPSAPEERVPGWLDAAFHGGAGGVAVARRFVEALPRRLAPGGEAFLVLSTRGDVDAVAAAAEAAGLAWEVAGEEAFFYERVQVWRLRVA